MRLAGADSLESFTGSQSLKLRLLRLVLDQGQRHQIGHRLCKQAVRRGPRLTRADLLKTEHALQLATDVNWRIKHGRHAMPRQVIGRKLGGQWMNVGIVS